MPRPNTSPTVAWTTDDQQIARAEEHDFYAESDNQTRKAMPGGATETHSARPGPIPALVTVSWVGWGVSACALRVVPRVPRF